MESPHRAVYEETYPLDSETAPGGVIVYYADGDEEIIHVNQYLVDLFECSSVDEFLDHVQGSFRHVVFEEDLSVIEDSIWGQVDQTNGFDHVYYRIRTRKGNLVTVNDYGRLIRNTDRKRPIFQVFISPVTPTTSVDWLTGLPNMLRFHELARIGAATLAARGKRPVAVSLDVMGMKTFNTRYGREEGDRLLCALANCLRKQFGNEACSRFAEDHYYAFAAEKGIEQKLQNVFADFAAVDFERVPPVRSGIYALDPEDDIVAVGFDRAKIACDLDRKTWQSHLMWFTDEMRTAARLRNHVLESLDEAIAQGWIQPYYQAIVRAATGDVCNEEALARWIDPKFGMLLPNQFIPDLEEAGLLYKLDLHVVDCVIADMKTKRAHGVPVVPVSMNFSLRDLMQLDLTQELSTRADAAGIPRGLLRIEITESVASTDPAFLREQVSTMHKAGFQVWMDDFGSGYSSLNTLQEFDFDLIKLDMGFLRSQEVHKAHVILAGIVQVAGKLGVGTLAEGVETREQAEFLESIGCDTLQGYHFSKPLSLDEVIQRSLTDGIRRERYDELVYWDAVSILSFNDFALGESGQNADWVPMTEFPIGVVECRKGEWRILRANRSYGEFLDQSGILSKGHSSLQANPVERELDPEFYAAANACLKSGKWEHIGGRHEYGSGFQFFVRHVTSVPDADAYMVATVPTMLGNALGIYGDVPVYYAVFRVIMDEQRTKVIDAEYVYANDMYCSSMGFSASELTGRSFLDVVDNASEVWFPYCYRAVHKRESVHDILYSPEAGHWMSFYLAPSPIEDCCVFAFANADNERRVHEEMMVGLDTSALIIAIANALSDEVSYDVAMNELLTTMSNIIHPDRLYVFERNGTTFDNTFEWCALGVDPQVSTLQNVDEAEFNTWKRMLETDSIVLIPDVEKLRGVDDRMHWQLSRQGITRVLAVPFRHDGEIIGYFGADNYVLDEGLDTRRLLETVASFVSSRIVNRRLLDRLERVGTYDELTNMLNRRGVDLAIDKCMTENPDEPFALALMDIDDFKILNDLNGYEVGDKALRMLASIVKGAFPAGTVLGRNGGDEFLAMLQGKDVRIIDQILDNVVNANMEFEHKGRRYSTSMSIGYVLCPEQTSKLRSAYSMADTALYAAKLSGKGRYRRYSAEMESQYRMQNGFTPRDIAENVPGGVVVHLSGDDRILFVNDELVEMFECETVSEFMEYTGGTFGGIVYSEDRERVKSDLAEQIDLGDVGKKDYVDFRILTKKGNIRHVADNGRLVELEGIGKVFYELVVNTDERATR